MPCPDDFLTSALSPSEAAATGYRGRLAPSPTGYLHLGHARTFWTAQERSRARKGILVLRNDDLDRARCRPEFVQAMTEDLRWFGFRWDEGPDCGGTFGPYNQGERFSVYRTAFDHLQAAGFIYPCACSRQDILHALAAPHEGEEEPVYPGICRPPIPGSIPNPAPARHCSWRFRVSDGESITFQDGNLGRQTFVAGKDFGDFVVWRHDDVPSYQLATVVDDAAMRISEVVRGADLLVSTARQILLYRALDLAAPDFFHCHLMRDESGARLAKRHDSLSLSQLRLRGESPVDLQTRFG